MRSRDADRKRAEELLGESDSALEALVGKPVAGTDQIQRIATERLRPSPFQPRIEIGEGELEQLASSIREAGVLEPLLVRRTGDGEYEIVAGERRWRAAQLAGLKEVPCLVRELDDTEAQIIALIENLHRRDLSDYERGRALRQLKESLGLSWQEIGEKVGLSRRSVLRLVRFAELPEEIEAEIGDGASVRHYEAVALLHDRPEQQKDLARVIRERGLSGPQAKRVARAVASGKARKVDTAVREVLKGAEAKKPREDVSELIGELMRLDLRIRGIAGVGLGSRQRKALMAALEEFRESMGEIIEELRRQ